MTARVVFTAQAREDIEQLYDFHLEHDIAAAEAALERIEHAITYLQDAPLAGRKIDADTPFLRELIIGFGDSGFVALYEAENAERVVILALRVQREDDYD